MTVHVSYKINYLEARHQGNSALPISSWDVNWCVIMEVSKSQLGNISDALITGMGEWVIPLFGPFLYG